MANPSLPNLLKLIGINAVFLWTGIASAAVQNGTYFAFIYLPDYAAVAIDSRVISGGNVSDDMCKLFPLSERVIFFLLEYMRAKIRRALSYLVLMSRPGRYFACLLIMICLI